MRKVNLILVALLVSLTNLFAQVTSDNQQIDQIKNLLKETNYKAARKLCDKMLVKEENNKATYYYLAAEAEMGQKNYNEAFQLIQKAIELKPDDSNCYLLRANIFSLAQKIEDAIDDLSLAIKHATADSIKREAYMLRGGTKSIKRDFKGAYSDLMQAYKIDSNHVFTLVNLGAVCDDLGKREEGMAFLEKAIKLDSTFVGGYANLGYQHQLMGNYEKSNEYYNKVLQLDPKQPLGYSNRSFNYLKLGKLKEAKADIDKAISLYPRNSFAFRNKALIYIEEKNYKAACESIEQALKLNFTQSYGKEMVELQEKYCSSK